MPVEPIIKDCNLFYWILDRYFRWCASSHIFIFVNRAPFAFPKMYVNRLRRDGRYFTRLDMNNRTNQKLVKIALIIIASDCVEHINAVLPKNDSEVVIIKKLIHLLSINSFATQLFKQY